MEGPYTPIEQNANGTIFEKPKSEWDTNDKRLAPINARAMSIL